ncbi:MAG: DUF4349 domain-containing protein [Fimbriimonadaceae bacterium]
MKHFSSLATLVAVGLTAAATIGCGEGYESSSAQAPATMEAASNPIVAERAVIRTGELTVRVSDLNSVERKARSLVAGFGGFVEKVTIGDRDAQVQRTSMTVRVPVAKFDQAMADFSALGKRLSSHESATDVTLQVVDLDARLKTLRAEEGSLQEMMKSARSVDASIRIHERLSTIRGEIESMDGQRRALARQAAMSTITLELEGDRIATAAGSADWSKDAWAGAQASSTELIQFAGTVGIYSIVLWPLWAVPLAVIGLGVWQSRRRRAVAIRAD